MIGMVIDVLFLSKHHRVFGKRVNRGEKWIKFQDRRCRQTNGPPVGELKVVRPVIA